MAASKTNIAPAKGQQPARTAPVVSPFRTVERLANGLTSILDEFGLGRGYSRVPVTGDVLTWTPRVDITRHNDELVVRVDLPGIEKNDVKVNVADDAITIQGERHRTQEEERDGVYRTERNYGAFYRAVPLPTGTTTDQAKASFKNGVLEIRMPAAPGVEGRSIEITG